MNIVPIVLPPLRDRKDDIPMLGLARNTLKAKIIKYNIAVME